MIVMEIPGDASYYSPMRNLNGVVVIVLGLLFVTGCTAPGRFVVKVHKHEIQAKLDGRFPVTKTKLVFEMRFENPVVAFDQEDRVEIGMQVRGFVAKIPLITTRAVIAGRLRYDSDRHEFLLMDPRVKGLELSHVPGQYIDQVRAEVDRVANQVMPAIPLYRLDPNKHSAARFFLKQAWVKGGVLHLEMGL